jgi:hypothetical protein
MISTSPAFWSTLATDPEFHHILQPRPTGGRIVLTWAPRTGLAWKDGIEGMITVRGRLWVLRFTKVRPGWPEGARTKPVEQISRTAEGLLEQIMKLTVTSKGFSRVV